MADELRIDTPEQTRLGYDIAGIGSRCIALTIDVAILFLSEAILVILLGILDPRLTSNLVRSWIVAFLMCLFAFLPWLYFTAFELLWQGQTPGKRACRIRVMKDEGYPVEFTDVLIRNILRFVDFLPAFFGLGTLVMFLNDKAKRLGDYAAGTVVVREEARAIDHLRKMETARRDGYALFDEYATRLRLTSDEFELIMGFLNRRRNFDNASRERLARKIALPLLTRCQVPSQMRELSLPSLEAFLKAVVRASQSETPGEEK